MSDSGSHIESVFLAPQRIHDPTDYAFNLPSMKWFRKLALHPQVTFFVGENGSGKSTMLEAIAIASGLNAEGTTFWAWTEPSWENRNRCHPEPNG